MKTSLKQWLHNHPFYVALFTAIFTALATTAAFREDLLPQLIGAYIVMLFVWASILCRDHVIVALLLAGLFSYNSVNGAEPAPPRQENGPAIGVAVVVICVGGFCVYKLVKVCQKLFPPKSTNSTENVYLSYAGSEYGAAYEYSTLGSCYVPPPPDLIGSPESDTNATTFTMNVTLQGGSALTTMTADRTPGATQTWDQFTSEIAGHGLFLAGRYGWQPQFEMDGVPCDPSLVPLSFDPTTGRVTHSTGGELRRVTIERSTDLQQWVAFMSTDVTDGTGFKVIDTTREGQMFYRIIVQ